MENNIHRAGVGDLIFLAIYGGCWRLQAWQIEVAGYSKFGNLCIVYF